MIVITLLWVTCGCVKVIVWRVKPLRKQLVPRWLCHASEGCTSSDLQCPVWRGECGRVRLVRGASRVTELYHNSITLIPNEETMKEMVGGVDLTERGTPGPGARWKGNECSWQTPCVQVGKLEAWGVGFQLSPCQPGELHTTTTVYVCVCETVYVCVCLSKMREMAPLIIIWAIQPPSFLMLSVRRTHCHLTFMIEVRSSPYCL